MSKSDDLLLFISLPFCWIDSSGLLEAIKKLIFFYFQINEFLQEATQFQEEQSEALLWRNHALVHLSDSRVQAHLNSQVIFRYWRPHGRPHGICGSPLATFQLTSDIKISHILWVVRLSNTVSQKTVRRDSFPSGQPVLKKSLNSLRQPTCLYCINRFLSCQPGHFTIQSHYNFWKPLHHSVDLFPSLKFISWLYWKVKRRSPKVRLNRSTIPWSLWAFIPSSYPHIMLCHFSSDTIHEFTPRINFLKKIKDCLKSPWDLRRILWGERFDSLESACNINNFKCIF